MRLVGRCIRPHKDKVSIHASVKDATNIGVKVKFHQRVSIHASVKDATEISTNTPVSFIVSIHASVKDATTQGLKRFFAAGFQSTHL